MSAQVGKMEILKKDGKFQLLKNGEPFLIKGAGYVGNRMDRLVEAGGNSLRTWSCDDAQQILDEALERGLSVLLGLDLGRERRGFDYDDKAAVEKQFIRLKEDVLKYKDHPALIMWGIGNELDLNYTNHNAWTAVNDISKMIHELDPNHLTLTVTAEIDRERVDLLKKMAPDIDMLGINSFRGSSTLYERLSAYKWDKPYLLTEWGCNGWWERPATSWNACLEPPSGLKKDVLIDRYKEIQESFGYCLGTYVFLWGQKQEKTPTWYSLFTREGEETEIINAIQTMWTQYPPDESVPNVTGISINGLAPDDNIHLESGKQYDTIVDVSYNENHAVYEWKILEESKSYNEGGDLEPDLNEIKGLVERKEGNTAVIKAPAEPGPYRLYVSVYNQKRKHGFANCPFYVK